MCWLPIWWNLFIWNYYHLFLLHCLCCRCVWVTCDLLKICIWICSYIKFIQFVAVVFFCFAFSILYLIRCSFFFYTFLKILNTSKLIWFHSIDSRTFLTKYLFFVYIPFSYLLKAWLLLLNIFCVSVSFLLVIFWFMVFNSCCINISIHIRRYYQLR